MNYKRLISIISFSMASAAFAQFDNSIGQKAMGTLGTNKITIINKTNDRLILKPYQHSEKPNAHNCMRNQPWSGISIPAKSTTNFDAEYNNSLGPCVIEASWQQYYIDGDKPAGFRYYRYLAKPVLDTRLYGGKYNITLKSLTATITKR